MESIHVIKQALKCFRGTGDPVLLKNLTFKILFHFWTFQTNTRDFLMEGGGQAMGEMS